MPLRTFQLQRWALSWPGQLARPPAALLTCSVLGCAAGSGGTTAPCSAAADAACAAAACAPACMPNAGAGAAAGCCCAACACCGSGSAAVGAGVVQGGPRSATGGGAVGEGSMPCWVHSPCRRRSSASSHTIFSFWRSLGVQEVIAGGREESKHRCGLQRARARQIETAQLSLRSNGWHDA